MKKYKIYLDDVRMPINQEWIVVRNYAEFIEKLTEIGFQNLSAVSLDHDLGDTAMEQYWENVVNGNRIDYSKITEKTGMDCAKWLTEKWMEDEPVFQVYCHSANPAGRDNILSLINTYYKIFNINLKAEAITIAHTY